MMRSVIGSDHEGLLFLLMPSGRLEIGGARDLVAALGFAVVGLSLSAIAMIAGLPLG